MMDIFDAKIMCKNCDKEMKKYIVDKKGFRLRTVKCDSCGNKIVHPNDLKELENYKNLKRKTYSVKLRVVGNSHAISIPKEIVDFINSTNKRVSGHMEDIVKLCFEDFGKLSLNFFDDSNGRKIKKWE